MVCKSCQNCRVKLPLKRKADGSFLNSTIDFKNGTVHCRAGHWTKTYGDEFYYKSFDRFMKTADSKRLRNNECPDFKSFRGQPKKDFSL